MKPLLTGLVLLFISGSSVALAQRTAPIRGVSSEECGVYLEDRRKDGGEMGRNSIEYAAWIQGYLSAYNLFATHPMVQPPVYATLVAFLDKYCRDDPVKPVMNVVDQILAELGGFRSPYLGK